MKKTLIYTVATLVASSAFAAWNSTTKAGDWSDVSIWNQGHIPNSDDQGANILNTVSVTGSETLNMGGNKTMFMKNNSSLVFEEGGVLTSSEIITIDGTSISMKFFGGRYVTTKNINQDTTGTKALTNYFGGIGSDGKFHAAAAKSIDSSARLQMAVGGSTNIALAASNLVDAKAATYDEKAIMYTTGELQVMQDVINLDFSNVTGESLIASGITESGTYYLPIISFGVTYKGLDSNAFTPTLGTAEPTDYVVFDKFEWANNKTSGGNTLYAVLGITVPAVPEPSTYAAIFGALALGFVAYRRRK